MLASSLDADPALAMSRGLTRGVTITVDLAAVRENLLEARRLAGGGKVFAVVKADAYGHGAAGVATALSRTDMPAAARADGFAVVTTGEASALREAGIRQPILVLQGPVDEADAGRCEALALWPVIHDTEQHAWYRAWWGARASKSRSATGEPALPGAWLKIDTGMGRLGVRADAVGAMLASPDGVSGGYVAWKGILSHLACADEPGNAHTQAQIETFAGLEDAATRHGLERSLANSAAVIAWPKTRFDWARPGLMLYGCNPLVASPSHAIPAPALRAAMRVTTTLLSVKTLDAGHGVGYAQTWRCPERMAVGLVRIGYADGLPRVLGPDARVAIGTAICPIVGRVSMDSIAVDLRTAPGARLGDAVELWGDRLTVDALADAAGTIAYELLTGIRGKRVQIDAPPGEPVPPEGEVR